MSCSPFDLRDYFLKELPEADRRQVDLHIQGCALCREELDRLHLTQAALLTLRDEEVPQRIAFVSDKIFEPSPARRWWTALWSSGPRLGFASAALLSAALVFSAVTRPAPLPAPAPASSASRATPAALQEEIDRRVAAAVTQAAARLEERQSRQTADLLSTLEKRYDLDRKGLILAMDENLQYLQKRLNRYIVASNQYDAPRSDSGGPR